MNCRICNKPIILTPSAKERAKMYGNTPEYYTKLFMTHAECALEERAERVKELIRRNNLELTT